jgi:hypothetical protein
MSKQNAIEPALPNAQQAGHITMAPGTTLTINVATPGIIITTVLGTQLANITAGTTYTVTETEFVPVAGADVGHHQN